MSVRFGVDRSPDAFGTWAKRRGLFFHPDVAFGVPTKTMGLGVFARRALKAGSVVASCPLSSCISPFTERHTFELPCTRALAAARVTDNVLYVVLCLMAETLRPSSPWLPWLKTCPRMPNHFFDFAAVGDVFGFHAGDTNTTPATVTASLTWTGPSQQLRDLKVEERWGVAQEVMRRHPEHWPEERATFSLFCECLAQVLSRNFHREEIEGREGPYLIPALDIFNHSFEASGKFEICGGGRKHPMNFCVIAARDICCGEQIFCSYGRIGAARFAVEFQFLTESVLKEDMLRFSVDVILEMTAALHLSGTMGSLPAVDLATIGKRVEWLQRLGFLFDEGFYVSRLPSPDAGRDALPAPLAKEIQTLFNVFYLMTVGAAEFEALVHTINRDWQATRTAAVVAVVSRVLAMRAEAAQLQLAAAEARFAGDQQQARRRLMQMTLNSELEMIRALERHVGQFC